MEKFCRHTKLVVARPEVPVAEAAVVMEMLVLAAAEIKEVIHLQKVILAGQVETTPTVAHEAAVAAAEELHRQDLPLLAHM